MKPLIFRAKTNEYPHEWVRGYSFEKGDQSYIQLIEQDKYVEVIKDTFCLSLPCKGYIRKKEHIKSHIYVNDIIKIDAKYNVGDTEMREYYWGEGEQSINIDKWIDVYIIGQVEWNPQKYQIRCKTIKCGQYFKSFCFGTHYVKFNIRKITILGNKFDGYDKE